MCNGASILASPVSGREEGSSLKISGPRSLQSQIEGNWRYQIDKMPFVPSLDYRIAMIAMGDADLSLARANARDWDIAAADLIAHEAGACLTDLSGVRPAYNTVDARHGPLIACRINEHEEMLALARIAVDKTSLN